jgi:hypothetical protein
MNSLCITTVHPRICQFFNRNPHLVFDDTIVSFIEILENSSTNIQLDSINVTENNSLHALNCLNKLKYASNQYIHFWTEEFITEKNKYLASLKSIVLDTSQSNFHQTITENFCQSINSILYNNLYTQQAKIQPLIKQYCLFVTSNVNILFQKKMDSHIFNEFETNFETNTKQFIFNINQSFKKFIQTKEELVSTLDLNENPTILYELTNLTNSFRSNNVSSFESALTKTFQTASISKDNNFFHLSRENKSTIFIELFQHNDRNISQQEVQQFQKHSAEKNTHSILISQHTGITGKSHFYIEIIHNRVLIYLHFLENNHEKIQMAVDIIDTLSSKLSEFSLNNDNKYSIPKDILDEINREYQSFIHQKESIITFIKDSHKKLLVQIEEIKFISLDKYLSTRYSSIKKQGYTCDLCNSFHVPTLKGLAAHKRGCARKNPGTDSLVEKSTNIICKPVM